MLIVRISFYMKVSGVAVRRNPIWHSSWYLVCWVPFCRVTEQRGIFFCGEDEVSDISLWIWHRLSYLDLAIWSQRLQLFLWKSFGIKIAFMVDIYSSFIRLLSHLSLRYHHQSINLFVVMLSFFFSNWVGFFCFPWIVGFNKFLVFDTCVSNMKMTFSFHIFIQNTNLVHFYVAAILVLSTAEFLNSFGDHSAICGKSLLYVP